MEIHYTVRTGDVLPYIETFMIKNQTNPCPPAIIEILRHKIIADLSQNPAMREFVFPFKGCPVRATLDMITD
jgi:hypothetical protein